MYSPEKAQEIKGFFRTLLDKVKSQATELEAKEAAIADLTTRLSDAMSRLQMADADAAEIGALFEELKVLATPANPTVIADAIVEFVAESPTIETPPVVEQAMAETVNTSEPTPVEAAEAAVVAVVTSVDAPVVE